MVSLTDLISRNGMEGWVMGGLGWISVDTTVLDIISRSLAHSSDTSLNSRRSCDEVPFHARDQFETCVIVLLARGCLGSPRHRSKRS